MKPTIQTQIILGLLLVAMVSSCPDEKYCVSCSLSRDGSEHVCKVCENTFYSAKTKGCDLTFTKNNDQCKSYRHTIDGINCVDCELGYYLDNEADNCLKCSVEGCAVCDKLGQCFGCSGKMKLDSKANICSKSEKCPVENCSICQTDNEREICRVCENGFALQDQVNGKCVPAVKDCFLIDSEDQAKCSICNYGFYISSSGTCESNTPSRWYIWIILLLIAVAIGGFLVYKKIQLKHARESEQLTSYLAE